MNTPARNDEIVANRTRKSVAIVGGGYTGLAAAYDLSQAGWNVSVFESQPELGGLAGTFEIVPGVKIEKFYHHWFTSDRAILGLIEEIGLGHKLKHVASNTGLYYANSVFRLSSPLDLLRFTALPFLSRIRTGLMALVARRISNWRPLEDETAEHWIKRIAGTRSWQVVWEPLLKGKFGLEAGNVSAVWIWNKLKLRGGSRNKKGGEELIYFDGSFGAFVDGLKEKLIQNGVKIYCGQAVQKIETQNGKVVGVVTQEGLVEVSSVLVTTPLPNFIEMTPDLPIAYKEKCAQIRFLGNVCLVLRIKHSLSSTYWLNVADPSFPFVGVIEHTNLDTPGGLEGQHIAFLSKYLHRDEALYRMSDSEVFEYCLPHISRIFPKFSREWVIGHAVWRAPYSQPVACKGYSSFIPPFKTPIEGLWLCTMAQIYPEDRGTNYAVQYGRQVASDIGALS